MPRPPALPRVAPEAQAFLDDIVANPDDDAPRLVYADWLDEHGDPHRAEFIRAQCERARLDADDPRADRLLRRERALLKAHGADWTGLPQGTGVAGELRRGFVGHVTLPVS